MKKILVIQLQQIGDVLLSTAVCQAIKEIFPDAQVDYAVCDFTMGVAENHPAINELKVIKKKAGIFEYLHFCKDLHAQKYDIVIDILCKPKSGLMAFLSGAKRRVSFSMRGRNFFYTDLVPRTDNRKVHTIKNRLELLEKLELSPTFNPYAKLYLRTEEIAYAKKRFVDSGLTDNDFKIIFGVNSRRFFKVWPNENFVKVINHCILKYDAKIIFFYSSSEKDLCVETKTKIDKPANVFMNFETKNLRELAAILSLGNLFVGNDSGPRHIAQGVGTPTLAIYSPSASKYNWNVEGDPSHQAYDIQDAENLSDTEYEEMLKEITNENAPEYLKKISPEFIIEKVDQMISDLKLVKK